MVTKQKKFFDAYGNDDTIAKFASEAATWKKLYQQSNRELAETKSELERVQNENKAIRLKVTSRDHYYQTFLPSFMVV